MGGMSEVGPIWPIVEQVFPVMQRVHDLGLTRGAAVRQFEAMEPLFKRALERRRHLDPQERAYQTIRACVRIATKELKAK